MSLLAAAGLTAGAGLLGSALSSLSQRDSNKANMKLAEYQFEKNKEMWNAQNEYNHPLEQMNRLKDAGLNPNLVYGHGAVGNTSSPAPKYEAPSMKAYTGFGDDFRNSMVSAYNVKNMVAQNENLRSQNEAIEAMAAMTKEKAAGQALQNKILALDHGIKESTYDSTINRMKMQEEELRQSIEFTRMQIDKKGVDIIGQRIKNDLLREDLKMKPLERRNLDLIIQTTLARLPIAQKEAQLMELGIRPQDGIIARIIAQTAHSLGIDMDLVGDTLMPVKKGASKIVDDIGNWWSGTWGVRQIWKHAFNVSGKKTIDYLNGK